MLKKVKDAWRVPTVKAALVAVVLEFISLYLPFYVQDNLSMSVMGAIAEKPSYYVGFPWVIYVGILWVLAFFLTNHPKLTLLGDFWLLFLGLSFCVDIRNHGLQTGMGVYVYFFMILVCMVCAILTRKQKKQKPEE